MNEEAKIIKVEEIPQDKAEKKNAKKPMLQTPEDVLKTFSKGELPLIQSIMSNGHEVFTLAYDFTLLTGWETVEAMGIDDKFNAYRISYKQAMSLFSAAAAKATPDVDKEDIASNLSPQDIIRAVQITTVFFNASSRATGGHTRMS